MEASIQALHPSSERKDSLKPLKSVTGFTLVEVVVSLTILSLVMAAAIAYLNFGTKSFDSGENQARAQRNALIVSQHLTNQLRNVNELALRLNTAPAPDNYIKGYKLDNGTFLEFSKSTAAGLHVNLISNINIQLAQSEKGFILTIEINATSKNRDFSMNNQMLLNNLKLSGIQGVEPDGRKYSLNRYTLYFN